MEAVKIRLKADVPVAIYLSGGLDSSSVAGIVSHLMKQGTKLGSEAGSVPTNMKCFTVQFDEDSGADESGMFTWPRNEIIVMASVLTNSSGCSAHSEMAGRRYSARQDG